MLKTVEDISSTKKRLKIEIPVDAIEKEIKDSLNSLKAKTKLPGFRPGKAPAALIEKKFGKEVESEVIEKVIPQYYAEALKEADIKPVSMPQLDGGINFQRNEPFSITFLVETRPEIKELNYEGVKVKSIPADIDESDVEATLKRLQEDKANYEPSGEPVAEGDLLIMDYEMKELGKSFKDEVFKVGNEMMPRAFSEKLIGMEKGDEAEFELEFPEDYFSKELAGARDTVKVEVKEIKKVVLPEVDDEFAKDLEFDTLGALKEHIRERLAKNKKETAERFMKAQIVSKVLDAHDFEPPESLVEEELRYQIANEKAGGSKDDEEALKVQLLPAAQRQVRASILLQVIGEKENVEVNDEDVNQKIQDIAARSNLSPENVMKYYISKEGSLEGIKHSVFEDRVLDILLERAIIEEGVEENKE
jgi:trigger factor